MIDFIGDIHGHRERLEALLKKLGYAKRRGAYRHPTNTAIFLGDYIDRGPDVRGTVTLVRDMVEAGSARALLGNHEFNALCFWQKNPSGGYLRDHSINKILIHTKTMESYRYAQEEFRGVLRWFLELPMFLEEPEFRALHACFDKKSAERLSAAGLVSIGSFDHLYEMYSKAGKFFTPVDTLLKGVECALPEGESFRDSEGVLRTRTRIKWWENPEGKTLRELAFQPGTRFPATPLSKNLQNRDFYGEGERPVFFGHYWLTGAPKLFRPNVCCLDYSVASYKGNGHLVAYRFGGERSLDKKNFAWV